MIKEEDMVVLISKVGYIKRVPVSQTKHQEEEQNRNSELPGKLVEEYANDDNS